MKSLILILLLSLVNSKYLACVRGRYGDLCDKICNCQEGYTCNDGVNGDGYCTSDAYDPVDDFTSQSTFDPHIAYTNSTKKLADLHFINTYTTLPADPIRSNTVRQVYHSFYSYVNPTPPKDYPPYLISVNKQLAKETFDLDENELETENFIKVFSGSALLKGMKPIAQCYGGHQFGSWSGQLGDGRAILIGEILNSKQQHYEIQLKGAGKTPYSRHGDGRAVLRSSVREYLASESMYYLNIPTTRSLSLIGSDLPIWRDQFYNGNGRNEKGAIVARVSPSFVRFGTFEIFHYRNEFDMVKQLADYVISHDFPHLQLELNKYQLFYREVIIRTAKLIAQWMAIGFAHGVLNTDNMSILGLTIDFGPFGFLDKYNPNFVPNTSDDDGRYKFKDQPKIGYWNLEKLGIALSSLMATIDCKEELDQYYWHTYRKFYLQLMQSKLGLNSINQEIDEEDEELVLELFNIMKSAGIDYTLFFRNFSENSEASNFQSVFGKFYDEFQEWHVNYENRFKIESKTLEERSTQMKLVNPKYVPRNWILQRAIEKAEEKDFSEIERLLELFRRPFDDNNEGSDLLIEPPHWSDLLKVSCSS